MSKFCSLFKFHLFNFINFCFIFLHGTLEYCYRKYDSLYLSIYLSGCICKDNRYKYVSQENIIPVLPIEIIIFSYNISYSNHLHKP